MTTATKGDEFAVWLVKTLRAAHLADARNVADKVVDYLTTFASNSADLLACRDSLAVLLADDDTSVFAVDNVDTLADEIISQYHLLMLNATASDDSGVCPSPIDYETAFPPLLQPTPPTSADIARLFSPSHAPTPPSTPPCEVSDYVAATAQSFDGSDPHFVVPRGAAPQPPSMRIGSLPTRIGQGFYPMVPRLMLPARSRVCSATYDNNDMAMFCVPRVATASSVRMGGAALAIPVNSATHFTPIRSDSMSWAYDDVINNGGASYEQPLLLHRPSAIADVPPALHHQAADWRTPNVSVSMWSASPSSLSASQLWHSGGADDSRGSNAASRHTSNRMEEEEERQDEDMDDEQLLSFVGGLATNAPLNASDE